MSSFPAIDARTFYLGEPIPEAPLPALPDAPGDVDYTLGTRIVPAGEAVLGQLRWPKGIGFHTGSQTIIGEPREAGEWTVRYTAYSGGVELAYVHFDIHVVERPDDS